jgi:hypothetical protein
MDADKALTFEFTNNDVKAPASPEKRWQKMNMHERTMWKKAHPGQRHPSLGPNDDENRLAADWVKSSIPTGPAEAIDDEG